MEHKHGEPWEVGNDVEIWAPSVIGEIKDPEKLARIVLCVNACAGLSDEEVGKVKEAISIIGPVRAFLDKIVPERDTLKSDLAEAVTLLRQSAFNANTRAAFDFADKVENFLAKYKAGN